MSLVPGIINTMTVLPGWVQYVEALGPLLALVAGLTAAGIAHRTYRHRRRHDRKEEWWRRTQWALDRATSGDQLVRVLGVGILELQAESRLADEEDNLVIDAFASRLLSPVEKHIPAVDFGVEYDESANQDEWEDS